MSDVTINNQIGAINQAIYTIDCELRQTPDPSGRCIDLQAQRHALECIITTLLWLAQTVDLLSPLLDMALAQGQEE